MIIDVYPPTQATQVDWLTVVTREERRGAADAPEETIVRVHLPSGEIVRIHVPRNYP